MGQQLDGGHSSCDEDSHALANGHIDDIQRLLDRGADVNERNGLLETPLEVVSSMDGELEIAKDVDQVWRGCEFSRLL